MARANPPLPLTGRGKITNDFDGETHVYTHKGGVVHAEILLPDHAPTAFSDRAAGIVSTDPAALLELIREFLQTVLVFSPNPLSS